jgi:hypothetical protein
MLARIGSALFVQMNAFGCLLVRSSLLRDAENAASELSELPRGVS